MKRKGQIKIRCDKCRWTGCISEMKVLRSHPSYGVKAICPSCKSNNERDGGTSFTIVEIRRIDGRKMNLR